jgi:hypothetical protein
MVWGCSQPVRACVCACVPPRTLALAWRVLSPAVGLAAPGEAHSPPAACIGRVCCRGSVQSAGCRRPGRVATVCSPPLVLFAGCGNGRQLHSCLACCRATWVCVRTHTGVHVGVSCRWGKHLHSAERAAPPVCLLLGACLCSQTGRSCFVCSCSCRWRPRVCATCSRSTLTVCCALLS